MNPYYFYFIVIIIIIIVIIIIAVIIIIIIIIIVIIIIIIIIILVSHASCDLQSNRHLFYSILPPLLSTHHHDNFSHFLFDTLQLLLLVIPFKSVSPNAPILGTLSLLSLFLFSILLSLFLSALYALSISPYLLLTLFTPLYHLYSSIIPYSSSLPF
jgi:hypothetical protein